MDAGFSVVWQGGDHQMSRSDVGRRREWTRSRRLFSGRGAAVALAVLLSAGGGGASAQQPRPLEPADRTGTIMGVVQGRLQVRITNTGDTWLIATQPRATVEVVGTASREMLAPKQFVQCAVEIDDLGKVTQPVAKVTFPGGGTPGVTAAGLDVSDPKARRPAGKRPAGSYIVSGFIKSADADAIVVQIGRERFEIPVPDDAELEVRTTNLGIVNVGDSVELEGEYLQRGQLMATSVKVSLANPLQLPQKGKKRPAGSP